MSLSDELPTASGFQQVRVPVDSLRTGDRLRSNLPEQEVEEVVTVMTGSGWRCRVVVSSGREHFEPGEMVEAFRRACQEPGPASDPMTKQADQGGHP